MFARSPLSAAAAAAPPSRASALSDSSLGNDFHSGEWVALSAPATREQLAALTAVPIGMLPNMLMGGRGSKARGKGMTKRAKGKNSLAREGQIVGSVFAGAGRRPYPNNGLSLEQIIQVELTAVYAIPFMTSSATVGLPAFAAQKFTINDFGAAGSLLAVFDQYRIDQIECWLEVPATNATSAFPELASAVDLDDANVPTSIGQVFDHLGALVSDGPSGHYHKFRPHIAVASYSGTFTSYTNAPSTWIDAASPSVQHFGLKACCIANSTSTFNFNLVTRAVISLRAPAIA